MQPTPSNPNATTLYRHSTQSEWGLAVLAWQRDDKRAYQFEDGKLRVFKRGYFNLLQPVDRPVDEGARVLSELSVKLGRSTRLEGNGADPIPIADQVAYFRSQYPEGFGGKRWTKRHRGPLDTKPLKRHRAAAIAQAAEVLSSDRLATDSPELAQAVMADLKALLRATDLVSKQHALHLERIDADRAVAVVAALRDLLGEETDLRQDFDRWVAVLERATGKPVSWQLATAPLALYAPHARMTIKRTTLARQAAWMAPRLNLTKQPTGTAYRRLLEMALALKEELAQRDLAPRDLMDVYDFVQVTLKPSAIKEMEAMSSTTGDATVSPAA